MKPSNRLILGSQSPRRQSLLKEAGFFFESKKIDVNEDFPDTLPCEEVAEFLAKKKNQVYRQSAKGEVILTADTVVIVDERILGKPSDDQEAYEMLRSLSDGIHEVVTGICVSNPEKSHAFSNLTKVKIKKLSDQEIYHYIDRYQPFDKAGAYGIQEWFGLIAIEWINGSFYNVVGLPIDQVYDILVNEFNVNPFHGN